MASNAALSVLLAFSAVTFAYAAALCAPEEPHVDCYFHSTSSPNWAPIAAQAKQLTASWKDVVGAVTAYPADSFSDKGLVITATKLDLVNVPVLLEVLQSYGFNLPVEIWYSGDVSSDIINTLSGTYKKLAIKNVANYARAEDLRSQGGRAYQAKVIAILNSKFEEVIFLDADNIPLSNPATLFDAAEYQRTGALFWPDFWQTASKNPIWSILNLKPGGWEQESGQMVINKKAAWTALNLAFFLAKDSTFQQMVNGDKEAFRLAFLATKTPFHMIQTAVATAGAIVDASFCGHTMVQHNTLGEAIFLHHNSMKHGNAMSWEVVKSTSGSSFSIVPLSAASIDGEPTSCMDMVGADVSIAPSPFRAFETFLAGFQASTDATLKAISQNEFTSAYGETMRKLLQANSTLGSTSCGSGGNTCYAANGAYFVCCSIPCDQGFAPDGNTPFCPGSLLFGTTVAPTPGPTTIGVRSTDGSCPGGNTYCYDYGSGANPLCCPSPAYECGFSTPSNPVAFCAPTPF